MKKIKLLEGEYRVYMVNLPPSVRGAVRLDRDGFPSIYINSALSIDAQKAAFRHEMRHIENDDFYNSKTIQEIEGL